MHLYGFDRPAVSDHLTATEFHTVADKQWFIDHFKKFVTKGMPRHLFTKRFYDRLNGCFGFCAEYDIYGFWSVWFEDMGAKARFLKQVLAHSCYGHADCTYSDAERIIIDWLESQPALL